MAITSVPTLSLEERGREERHRHREMANVSYEGEVEAAEILLVLGSKREFTREVPSMFLYGFGTSSGM